jgi:hypothetical protein
MANSTIVSSLLFSSKQKTFSRAGLGFSFQIVCNKKYSFAALRSSRLGSNQEWAKSRQ